MTEVVAGDEENKSSFSSNKLVSSFRDPAGSLVSIDGRLLRILTEAGEKDATSFLACPKAQLWMQQRKLVSSSVLSASQKAEALTESRLNSLYQRSNGKVIIEHEKLWFPSFPYEWPAEMLHAAGALTLELAEGLVDEGLGLKDGTPYNVLFRGPEPMFIDLLSFEQRNPGDATWLAYAQFVRAFLLPLLAYKYFHLPLDVTLTTRRDGLDPDEVYGWLGPLQKIVPPFISLVSFPHWLGAKHNPDETKLYQKRVLGNPEKARFVLLSLFRRLRRSLNALAPDSSRQSGWSSYMASTNNYESEQFAAKESFVKQALAEASAKQVLDVGCNTGHFTAMAARAGAEVVAIDSDPVVAGNVWRNAKADQLRILPLVVDLARPTAALGWRNQECASFLDRARGSFDAVLMLAVIHHMLVTERIPLDEIVDLAADLTKDSLIIEFVGPADSMFRRLTRGREELHKALTAEVFESRIRRRFRIVRHQHLPGSHRHLYWLRK